MVLVCDDLDETVDGLVVKPLLEVIYLGIVFVEGLLGSLEFNHLADHLVQQISNTFGGGGRMGFSLFASSNVQCTQQSLKHI